MAKILVIEDEIILREEVVEWLTLEGYDTLGAEDGAEGAEFALQFLPDLIICDVMMPRMDGYEVLSRLRAQPETTAIPFIFVTARASQDDIRKGTAAGADSYLTKPFSHVELLHAIEMHLSAR